MTNTPSPLAPISRVDRELLLGQRGHVLWFTGLSGAGKTTLSCELERHLVAEGLLTTRLDADLLRSRLNADLGFSPTDRAENLRRITEVADLLVACGVLVLVAAISPYAEHRRAARERLGRESFTLIHVATAVEVCESRDVKGLYRRARAGELSEFTGVSAPYEIPTDADLVIDTIESVEVTASRLMQALRERGVGGRRR